MLLLKRYLGFFLPPQNTSTAWLLLVAKMILFLLALIKNSFPACLETVCQCHCVVFIFTEITIIFARDSAKTKIKVYDYKKRSNKGKHNIRNYILLIATKLFW